MFKMTYILMYVFQHPFFNHIAEYVYEKDRMFGCYLLVRKPTGIGSGKLSASGYGVRIA